MATSTSYHKIWIGLLMALITSLGLMATDIYTPALPAVTQALQTSAYQVKLTITLFLIAAGLSQLIYGPLSDHWGRRHLLITGMSIYLIGSILCTVSHSMPLLLLGRFIQGVGTGGIMALNRIIIRDVFSGIGLAKALSYLGAFVALAPAIAPALGGFIEIHAGWRAVFGFLLGYSTILIGLTYFTLPETHHNRPEIPLSLASVTKNYLHILKNRHFWANAWCSGLALAAMMTCATINPFILENDMGKTPAEYGFFTMISTTGFLLGMLINSRVVERLGIERTLSIGHGLIFIMGIALIVTGYFKLLTISAIIIPTIGVELGIALVFPNAFIGAIAPFSQSGGAAAALYGCLQVAISFIASVIVAMISESTQLPMGVLLSCLAILGLVIYQWLNEPAAVKATERPPIVE